MEITILENLGLTKSEIKIYLALLKIGQSSITLLVKESEVPSAKIYEFLNRLIEKGLVSYVIKSNKRYFSAANPESLKNIIKQNKEKINEQENKINQLIPQLKEIQLEQKDAISSEIYEGLKGLKSVYEKILSNLKEGETQYIIGAPKEGNEAVEGYLLDWHKRRIKKKIKCKYIYNQNAKEYGQIRAKMPFTEVKYFPKEITSPVWIEIFKDYVATGHIKRSNAIMFLIKDKEIAKSYLDYFELLWKIAKP